MLLLANTHMKYQLCSPSGKPWCCLLGAWKQIILPPECYTAALVLVVSSVCVNICYWKRTTLALWKYSCTEIEPTSILSLGVCFPLSSLLLGCTAEFGDMIHAALCAVIRMQLIVMSWFQCHLNSNSNNQCVWGSTCFNVLSVSDTFLIKSLSPKLLYAAALLLFYRVISDDTFGQQDAVLY